MTGMEKSVEVSAGETIFIEKAFDYMWISAPRSPGERRILVLSLILIGILLLLFGLIAYVSFLKWTAPSNYIARDPSLLPFLLISIVTYWSGGVGSITVAAVYIAKIRKRYGAYPFSVGLGPLRAGSFK